MCMENEVVRDYLSLMIDIFLVICLGAVGGFVHIAPGPCKTKCFASK